MRIILILIGAVVVSAFLMAMPILATCSFVFNWIEGYQFLLTVACLLELLGLIAAIFTSFSEDE